MSDDPYDSTVETKKHIARVFDILGGVELEINERRYAHDLSKLGPVEKPLFDEYTPKLAKMTYGSGEYTAALHHLGPALKHHYAHNRHHPEHFENGIDDMTLIDLIEMLCDWKAATERHNDGDIFKSLIHNAKRFGISEQLAKILENTVRDPKLGLC
jgi:hypothetical protein